jgi:hypothetical protein
LGVHYDVVRYRIALLLTLVAAVVSAGCGGVDASVRTELGGGVHATVVALPPPPGNVHVIGVWLVRQGGAVLWGASTQVDKGELLPRAPADFVARSVDFGRHWSWARSDGAIPGGTATACDVDCSTVELSPARAMRVQMDGDDYIGAFVRWTDEGRDWSHDFFRHVDLGCARKIGVVEKLWTPVLTTSKDLFLVGSCGEHFHLRSMRIVRTTTALDRFDVVTVRGGDVAPNAWPIGPVAISHGLLSVFVDREQKPAALLVTGNAAATS